MLEHIIMSNHQSHSFSDLTLEQRPARPPPLRSSRGDHSPSQLSRRKLSPIFLSASADELAHHGSVTRSTDDHF